MINIENKIIYFGYGDIKLGYSTYSLYFRGFKPPIEIGTFITEKVIKDNNIEWLTDDIFLDFKDMQEILTFENLIKQVADNNGENFVQFKFKDLTFDFSNYNRKCVDILLCYLASIRENYLKIIAC